MINDLLNRLFDGKCSGSFSTWSTTAGLSDTEVRQLREMLDRLEDESR